MPYGFFTVEKWEFPKRGRKGKWVPIANLDVPQTLTDALNFIEQRGRPGFFRVVQTQRMVWVEMKNGKLMAHRWHVGSAQKLQRTGRTLMRDKGKRPAPNRRA